MRETRRRRLTRGIGGAAGALDGRLQLVRPEQRQAGNTTTHPLETGDQMSLEDNKALVRRFYMEIDRGNLDAMDELVGENYLNHDPAPFPDAPPGRAGLKYAFEQFWRATPGRHVIEDQIAEGSLVVT